MKSIVGIVEICDWYNQRLRRKHKQYGMLALELSSYFLLEIPNDAYTTPSQILLAVQHSVESTVSLLVDVRKL